MFKWLLKAASEERSDQSGLAASSHVMRGLKELYRTRLKPLEEASRFHLFHSPVIEEAEFDSKPMVLLLGQYSTGKTTFISNLLQRDYPGMRIGPEPTTDSFVAIMMGDIDPVSGSVNEGVVPGNTLVVDPKKPFRGLSTFGDGFLERFFGSQLNHELLKKLTFIDTPGILSGSQQRSHRGYDYSSVLQWLAERADRIILLFDAHKLDISDELDDALQIIKSHEDKFRIILNKSDHVPPQQLLRVYGALMWSLGKIIDTPEVVRIYIGTFWDQPLRYEMLRNLFQDEQENFLDDLKSLPRYADLRKLNDLLRRSTLVKAHAYLIGYLWSQMPVMFGYEKMKMRLVDNLESVYAKLSCKYHLSLGDFPKVEVMREKLKKTDFRQFCKINNQLIQKVDDMLTTDMSDLMKLVQREEAEYQMADTTKCEINNKTFNWGRLNPFQEFGVSIGAGNGSSPDSKWVVEEVMEELRETFEGFELFEGKLKATDAKQEMLKSKLPNTSLACVWRLCDHDHDGMLTLEEFALGVYLIKLLKEGERLPKTLPLHLVPPSQRVSSNAAPPKPDLIPATTS